jgi:signal transduction histidine kinase
MLSSLRARLLIWHAALLALIVILFAGLVAWLSWRSGVADVDAQLRARGNLLVYALEPAGPGTFDFRIPAAVLEPGDDTYHAVWAADGALIDRSEEAEDRAAPPPPGVASRDGRRELVTAGPSGATVLVGRSLAPVSSNVRSLLWMMAGVGLVSLAISLAAGWLLVGRALAPIDRIGRTARAMGAGDLAARIPVDEVETELGHLAGALNDAFQRLQEAIERQRRFTADASHELRTPLATISTEVQWALGRERSLAEYRRSLATIERAAMRMNGVVARLLTLARIEAGAPRAPAERVELEALLQQVAADLEPLAASRKVSIDLDAAPAVVSGERAALYEAITQVVVNAIQYNVDGGVVRIRLTCEAGAARLAVADTGIGISDRDLPRVFEPFFRADPARARETGGAGLGLAVAQAIVARHGGRMSCTSTAGKGTTVEIAIPGGTNPTG